MQNTIDKIAAISTIVVSKNGLTFGNSFFRTFEMATIIPSGGR